ncbi:hypothetical protein [Roseomonas rosulenta]|uniref:hypothetical protein n=1 Tax=Roseomonas rosulenta TaxID=2748667 RepID=UPI0018E04597|nr:hypothetical protein [Roseomonas rosulenta]
MARSIPVVLSLVLGLGACGTDNYFPAQDFDRRGTWQAEGINDRNLRAQVADPAHLTRGAGAATDRGEQASTAVRALNEGRRPRLPNIQFEAGGGSSGAAGVTSGGGGGSSGR